MKFLIDSALSPLFAQALSKAGHDAVHVRDIGLGDALDEVIFEKAASEDRVLVSADTDFGTLLALREKTSPSVVIFRRTKGRKPREQAAALLANLAGLKQYLEEGAVIVLEKERIRVRSLPI